MYIYHILGSLKEDHGPSWGSRAPQSLVAWAEVRCYQKDMGPSFFPLFGLQLYKLFFLSFFLSLSASVCLHIWSNVFTSKDWICWIYLSLNLECMLLFFLLHACLARFAHPGQEALAVVWCRGDFQRRYRQTMYCSQNRLQLGLITPPKFNSSPLKNDGWKLPSYWEGNFSGAMLNFGRGGSWIKQGSWNMSPTRKQCTKNKGRSFEITT